MTIDSTVFEFVRHERLAWDAHCNGVHAYHAWAFEKRDGGEAFNLNVAVSVRRYRALFMDA